MNSVRKFSIECKISDTMNADFGEASCHDVDSVLTKFKILHSRTIFLVNIACQHL